MSDIATMARPQRWDAPFDPEMSADDVEMLMKRPEFSAIDATRFPISMPLAGILGNDCRILQCKPGDIVIREGDYGNSAFLTMKGSLRVVVKPGLPNDVLGRSTMKKRGLFGALAQIWRNSPFPEARDTSARASAERETARLSLFDSKDWRAVFSAPPAKAGGDITEVPPLKSHYQTASLRAGAIFGEIAALSRVPRTATIYAQSHATLLEIRWQGLNAIRKYDDGWRRIVDEGYRKNQLKVQLKEHPMLKHLDEATLQRVADRTLFESFGSFEWNREYKLSRESEMRVADEPLIAKEGDYTDGLLLLGAGFARVSMRLGNGRRTLTYLRTGDHFGMDELHSAWADGKKIPLQTSLSALGYVNVLRVPANVLDELVFPTLEKPVRPLSELANRPLAADALLEWAVDERFMNGTRAMLIDMDRCVRCDDCVRACASTHGGNPRFVRHGKTHANAMVANACMHCVDPVCMIGCPTGAIHRSVAGPVVINDDTCIGCGTCANSCPYDNIRLVEIHDRRGRPLLDPETQSPIVKATKCDLCYTQLGGPACVRACPHDALRRVDFREDALRAAQNE